MEKHPPSVSRQWSSRGCLIAGLLVLAWALIVYPIAMIGQFLLHLMTSGLFAAGLLLCLCSSSASEYRVVTNDLGEAITLYDPPAGYSLMGAPITEDNQNQQASSYGPSAKCSIAQNVEMVLTLPQHDYGIGDTLLATVQIRNRSQEIFGFYNGNVSCSILSPNNILIGTTPGRGEVSYPQASHGLHIIQIYPQREKRFDFAFDTKQLEGGVYQLHAAFVRVGPGISPEHEYSMQVETSIGLVQKPGIDQLEKDISGNALSFGRKEYLGHVASRADKSANNSPESVSSSHLNEQFWRDKLLWGILSFLCLALAIIFYRAHRRSVR